VDIGQLHLPTLRSMIALVPQQPRLFADTIRANITYGLDPCSRLNSKQNVEAAAQAAGIDEFIQSLPEGYSTLVGSGGLDLSGGQAQRVVIARALVRHPSVLILDEATSNLDPESAETIRRSVQKLVAARQGLTVVMITHTREMMAMADTVVVIDHGTVVEQGPYRVLLQRSGGKLREMMTGGEMFEA
jgi:ATP-binding cassette subfamily B (MDR/TAP) protein 1